MSFYPTAGTWSINEFSDSSGTFVNPTYQGITGGYVCLLPSNTDEYTYISSWAPYTGWNVNNGLETRARISGSFYIYSGIQRPVGIYSGATAYQSSVTSAGAWEIFTDYPSSTTGNINVQYFGLTKTAPFSGWTNYFLAGGNTATIEFDVASFVDPYSGTDILAGYATGQHSLTGLPRKTGIIGHGIYLSNGTYCDILEVLPYGIRSVSHPELAIAKDLGQPTRFRVGLSNQDIYIQCEDGKSVAGMSKFDTVTTNHSGSVLVGALPITGSIASIGTDLSVNACVGNTYWGLFRTVTGALVTQVLSGHQQVYSTSAATMYTDVFDPSIQITSFLNAEIGYVPQYGGNTVVTAQYSGAAGFTDVVSATINNNTTTNPIVLDLSALPVHTYPISDLTNGYISNPVRFKIVQTSSNGKAPAPAIDYIKINCSSERAYLDLLPNWKRTNTSATIQAYIRTGEFLTAPPEANVWTSLLINSPVCDGYTGSFIDSSLSGIVVSVIGSGQINPGGYYGYCFTNYDVSTATARSGSTAASFLGRSPVSNVFPNPLFSEYKPASNEPNYVSGYCFGELATHTYIPGGYTGLVPVYYSATEIYRPESAARENRIYNILGLATNPTVNYMQTVDVPSVNTLGVHNGTVGIESRIPSGIATSSMLVDVDLGIPIGNGITIYVTGNATTGSWYIPGEDFRIHRQISFPVNGTNSGEIRIGFVVPSGTSLQTSTQFNLDNLTVTPIYNGYLLATGLPLYTHKSGIINDKTVLGFTPPPVRASTLFDTDIYLDSYPLTTGTIFKVIDASSHGLSITLDAQGYITAAFDLASNAWAQNFLSDSFYSYLGKQYVVSSQRIPIGRWVNLGVAHYSNTYDKLSTVNYSGAAAPTLCAATNRAVITFDGLPVQSVDCESGWYRRNYIDGVTFDAMPVPSYITCTGSNTVTIMSGLYGRIDGLRVDRPPVVDPEVGLSIFGARTTTPYFVPDKLSNGTISSSVHNVHVDTALWDSSFGYDTYLGSCYNFAGPGYTNWDHGPWRNHLLFSGNVSKEVISPYSGLGSTRFQTGSYAIAKYSSATERWMNSVANNDIVGSLTTTVEQGLGRITAKGWIYPRTTGTIFSILADQAYFTGDRFDLSINSSGYLEVNRFVTGSQMFSKTGTVSHAFSGWAYVGFDYLPGNSKYTVGSTGTCVVTIFNGSGYEITAPITGINYGFRYCGHTGDTSSSAFLFGNQIDANYCDWVIQIPRNSQYPGPYDLSGNFYYTGNKGGRYQTLMHNSSISTAEVEYTGYNVATITLPVSTAASTSAYWIAAMNAYDNNARLNGGALLYDTVPFEEVESYRVTYNTSGLEEAIGETNSPIRIGRVVPPNAINIARIDNQEFTVDGSITTIDLSDKNVNNLSDYRGGQFSIRRNNGTVSASTATGTYYGITLLTGSADVVFSGTLYSSNIELSNMPISSIDLTSPAEAYYFYPVGNATKYVYVPDSEAHTYTGTVGTGMACDAYITNLTKVKKSISIKTTDGSILSMDEYPWDITISPFELATGTQPVLPQNVFRVTLLTNQKYIPGTTVWVHYSAYDLLTSKVEGAFKEIVNPIPIFRQSLPTEIPEVGRYSITEANEGYGYSLVFYGLESGLSGSI